MMENCLSFTVAGKFWKPLQHNQISHPFVEIIQNLTTFNNIWMNEVSLCICLIDFLIKGNASSKQNEWEEGQLNWSAKMSHMKKKISSLRRFHNTTLHSTHTILQPDTVWVVYYSTSHPQPHSQQSLVWGFHLWYFNVVYPLGFVSKISSLQLWKRQLLRMKIKCLPAVNAESCNVIPAHFSLHLKVSCKVFFFFCLFLFFADYETDWN